MKRAIRAFLLAPLTAPVVFWAWHLVASLAGGPEERRAVMSSLLRELVAAVAFGAPIAYGAAVVALAIGFRLLRIRGLPGAAAVTLLGAAVGVATTVVLQPHLGRDLFRLVLTPVQGAAMGGLSALCFWRLWTPWRGRPG